MNSLLMETFPLMNFEQRSRVRYLAQQYQALKRELVLLQSPSSIEPRLQSPRSGIDPRFLEGEHVAVENQPL